MTTNTREGEVYSKVSLLISFLSHMKRLTASTEALLDSLDPSVSAQQQQPESLVTINDSLLRIALHRIACILSPTQTDILCALFKLYAEGLGIKHRGVASCSGLIVWLV